MAKGRTYQNTYADSYVRKMVVKEVGSLLDLLIVKEITSPKIIEMEFDITAPTIRAVRRKLDSVSFETIRKCCFIIGYYLHKEIVATEKCKSHVTEREMWFKMLYKMQQKYQNIYGLQAEVVMDLIRKDKDLSQFVLNTDGKDENL